MQDGKGLWQSVLGEIEVNFTQAHFSTWLRPTYVISNEYGHLVVWVPNIFNKQWLENKYHTDIKAALAKVDSGIHTVEYKVVAKSKAAPSHTPSTAHPA